MRVGVAIVVLVLVTGCSPGMLRVGSSGDYPPFSIRDADGRWRGFDLEVARAYADARGRTLRVVPFSWPELGAALARGDFDLAMGGVTVRADRLIEGVFTASVAAADAVLLVRPDAPPPRLVAVNRGGHLERVARSELDVALYRVDDNRSLPMLLLSGGVDGVVMDTLEAAPLLADGSARVAAVLSHDQKAYWTAPAKMALAADLDRWLLERERSGWLPALRARELGRGEVMPLPADAARVAELSGRRLMLMPAVARAKCAAKLPLDDPTREAEVERAAAERAAAAGLDVGAYLGVVRAQIAAAKAVQQASHSAQAPPASLAALRAAIDRIDDALTTALRAAAPIRVDPVTMAQGIAEVANLPFVDAETTAPLAQALLALPAAR